ncbi:VOC family protein [Membranihabitans marinus]|uniref:VOC family protein n=1 Tax=Membranihabitans marinus TaxID=1227546 RepID=UPI001F21CF87|nr:VOC family protein [Membranihabitans marinus]
MASVSTYLNFERNTEAAFNFYKSVFNSEFDGQGIVRMNSIPPQEGMPPLSEEDGQLVMHVEMTILGCHKIMGTDSPESMGFNLNKGNNIHINLQPDTRVETQRLFKALSSEGRVTMDLQEMFWGDYFGSCIDPFGVQWMFNCSSRE